MPSCAFNKFNSFVEAVAEKKHNLGSDTLKFALSNTAPSASNTVLADITQVSYTNLGGTPGSSRTLTVSSSAQSGGTYKLVIDDVTITASGGALAQWRYFIIYNDTATNDELIGWYDYGSALAALADGESVTVDFDGTNGILTIV